VNLAKGRNSPKATIVDSKLPINFHHVTGPQSLVRVLHNYLVRLHGAKWGWGGSFVPDVMGKRWKAGISEVTDLLDVSEAAERKVLKKHRHVVGQIESHCNYPNVAPLTRPAKLVPFS